MSWQFKTHADVADISLLGWINEQMCSLSPSEALGAKAFSFHYEDEQMAVVFWNEKHATKLRPPTCPPNSKWECHVVPSGTLEESIEFIEDKLNATEDRSSSSAYHGRVVTTSGGRLCLLIASADAEATSKDPLESLIANVESEIRETWERKQ